jgi:hypothetical protein
MKFVKSAANVHEEFVTPTEPYLTPLLSPFFHPLTLSSFPLSVLSTEDVLKRAFFNLKKILFLKKIILTCINLGSLSFLVYVLV